MRMAANVLQAQVEEGARLKKRRRRKNTLFARFTRANWLQRPKRRHADRPNCETARRHSGSDGKGGAFFEHDELSVKRATSKKREEKRREDGGPNWKVA